MKSKLTSSKSVIAIFCTIFLISFNVPAQFNDMFNNSITEDSVCLEMKGKIIKGRKASTSNYTVTLIHNNMVVDYAVIKDNKSFRFNLLADSYYPNSANVV